LFFDKNKLLNNKNIINHHHIIQKKNIKSKNILWLLSAVYFLSLANRELVVLYLLKTNCRVSGQLHNNIVLGLFIVALIVVCQI